MALVIQPGILSYVHHQTIASNLWEINHNFNKKALAVDCMININGNLETALPSNIIYVNDNTIHIEWNTLKTGYARIA